MSSTPPPLSHSRKAGQESSDRRVRRHRDRGDRKTSQDPQQRPTDWIYTTLRSKNSQQHYDAAEPPLFEVEPSPKLALKDDGEKLRVLARRVREAKGAFEDMQEKARLVLDEYIDSLLEVERKADSYERAPCISGIDWKELTMLLKTVQGYSKGLLTPLDPTFACGHIVELSRTVQKPLKRAMAKPPDTYTECDPEDWDDKYSADDYINGSFDEQ